MKPYTQDKTVHYPNMSKSKMIALDTETYDPELEKSGPGVYRGDGNLLGFSIADESGFAEYYNLGHKGISSEEKRRNYDYLRKVCALDIPKVGANIRYDLDWIENWANIPVNGDIHDIQIAEPLIDEYGQYSLDAISQKYLGRYKYKAEIQGWCDDHGLSGDPRQYLWMMPYETVRPYGKEDAIEPIEIFQLQWKVMKEENLLGIYDIERRLIRPLLAMRRAGVKMDIPYISKAIKELQTSIKDLEKQLYAEYGEFNYNSTKQMAKIFDKLGLSYRTIAKTGNPSITADDLEIMDHPIAEKLLDVKRYKKTLSTFFINAFSENRVGEYIHGMFNQLKADEYGTITGRLSASLPNLQQIPARHKYLGPLCRRAFIPEDNCWWGRIDWSQIEYRIIAHYAEGPRSDEVREQYNNNPATDYHEFVMGLTGLERKPAKNLNFGAAYFMGPSTCSKKFHWDIDTAKELLSLYHDKVPFVRHTGDLVAEVAESRGYIKTLAGRRSRVTPEMVARGKTFVMFNHLIQGTAADIMKIAMVRAWDEGLFKILTFHLTVHDELGVSIPKTKEGILAYKRLKEIMETCVELKVPILAEAEIGTNWHDVEPFDPEKLIEELENAS